MDEELKSRLEKKGIYSIGRFFYNLPSFTENADGNREIINKRCVGPIEVIIYGITKDNEYYFDWTYPEFYPDDSELERSYKIITKQKILDALDLEIEVCRNNNCKKLIEEYEIAKARIQNDQI